MLGAIDLRASGVACFAWVQSEAWSWIANVPQQSRVALSILLPLVAVLLFTYVLERNEGND